ncbi:MAG: hypothetical protein R2712_24120 [Vicinamibacterales bacterium]
MLAGRAADAAWVRERSDATSFARRLLTFLAVGALLYVACCAVAESIAARHTARNRLRTIATTPHNEFDAVILGASHAGVLDYRDMNARLESATGARILNLSIAGAGVTPNRIVLDYFLTRHRARALVYVVDSFIFQSAEWNEVRAADRALYARAPLDPALAWRLIQEPATRWTAVDYATGFAMLNDASRFEPDVPDEEGRGSIGRIVPSARSTTSAWRISTPRHGRRRPKPGTSRSSVTCCGWRARRAWPSSP